MYHSWKRSFVTRMLYSQDKPDIIYFELILEDQLKGDKCISFHGLTGIIEHIIGIIYIPKTGIHTLRDHSQNITKYSNYKPIIISPRVWPFFFLSLSIE